MAFSVSPSVIVREVDASASVPAIATPPAAMAGVFRWGPVNDPVLITSETELANRFGAPNDDNYETFFTAADYLAYANALWVVRADDDSAKADSSTIVRDGNNDIIVESSTFGAFEAKHQGTLGESLEVAYCSATGFEDASIAIGAIQTQSEINALISANSTLDETIDFNTSTIDFVVEAANRITSIGVNDTIRIGNNTVGYQELKVTAFAEQGYEADFDTTDAANTACVGIKYTIGVTPNYTLSALNLDEVSITKKWEHASLFTSAPSAGHVHVAVVDGDGKISGDAGTVLELFENLSTTDGDTYEDGRDQFLTSVIENNSAWISVANTAVIGDASSALSEYETFTGAGTPKTESNATLANIGPALDLLKNDNEIDISFVLQGKGANDGTTANYIVSNIAEYRKDCVAFLSPSKEAVVDVSAVQDKLDGAIEYRNKIGNSSYWFMDSGYKYRYDKYNDKYRWTPLNGDMAGLASRVEVWESPAGYRKGVVKNAIKLAFNPSKAHRDQLYSKDINPVMSQAGQGIILFGDKTGYGLNSAFDRINVRRLFIAVEKAIATAAKGFLFELNDDFTQSQFKNIVDPFLRDIQGRRGIIDFRVVSDATVNTPAVVDQNKFRANIYIQPARSINIIELTFVATRSGVEFDEIVGSIR